MWDLLDGRRRGALYGAASPPTRRIPTPCTFSALLPCSRADHSEQPELIGRAIAAGRAAAFDANLAEAYRVLGQFDHPPAATPAIAALRLAHLTSPRPPTTSGCRAARLCPKPTRPSPIFRAAGRQQAGFRHGLQQPRQRPCAPRRSSQGRLPTSAGGPWRSTPTWPRPGPTSGNSAGAARFAGPLVHCREGRPPARTWPSLRARNNLGNAAARPGKLAEAKACYAEVQRLNPGPGP